MNFGRDPYGDISSVRDRINRMFDEQAGPEDRQRASAARVWRPLADIVEDRDAWTVHVDLPGVRRESVDIQLTAEGLSVRGERRSPRPEGTHLLRCERPEGSFLFVLPIQAPIDHERVQATFRDGVLSVRLPKSDALKPRRIQIQGGEAETGGERLSASVESAPDGEGNAAPRATRERAKQG